MNIILGVFRVVILMLILATVFHTLHIFFGVLPSMDYSPALHPAKSFHTLVDIFGLIALSYAYFRLLQESK